MKLQAPKRRGITLETEQETDEERKGKSERQEADAEQEGSNDEDQGLVNAGNENGQREQSLPFLWKESVLSE